MTDSKSIESVTEKLKKSEHWRDDFKVVEIENAGGTKIYRVEASDYNPTTVLAIARLHEIIEV